MLDASRRHSKVISDLKYIIMEGPQQAPLFIQKNIYPSEDISNSHAVMEDEGIPHCKLTEIMYINLHKRACSHGTVRNVNLRCQKRDTSFPGSQRPLILARLQEKGLTVINPTPSRSIKS